MQRGLAMAGKADVAGSPLEPLLFGPSLEIEAIASRWSVPRLSLALAIADVLVLVTAYIAVAFRIDSYTFDLCIPDPLRMVVWCLVLVSIWLPIAINHEAYKRTTIRNPLRS